MKAVVTEIEGITSYQTPLYDDKYQAVNDYSKLISPLVNYFNSSIPGTYSITLPEGIYNIILVGAGGGGNIYHYSIGQTKRGGGSGALIIGSIHIPAGTYEVVVGEGGTKNVEGGDSSFYNQIAGGGGASGTNPTGGVYTITENSLTGTNGNAGSSGQIGASVYPPYGYGGYPNTYNGASGYVKITGVKQ